MNTLEASTLPPRPWSGLNPVERSPDDPLIGTIGLGQAPKDHPGKLGSSIPLQTVLICRSMPILPRSSERKIVASTSHE